MLGDKIELTRDSVFVTDVKDQKLGAEKYKKFQKKTYTREEVDR